MSSSANDRARGDARHTPLIIGLFRGILASIIIGIVVGVIQGDRIVNELKAWREMICVMVGPCGNSKPAMPTKPASPKLGDSPCRCCKSSPEVPCII